MRSGGINRNTLRMRILLIIVFIFTLTLVSGEYYACCSAFNARKSHCIDITESCCDIINGTFVHDSTCHGDLSGNGVDDVCDKIFCGNGVLEPWEACDDGNTLSGDGCSEDCVIEHGVCCQYHIDNGLSVECQEMDSDANCVASFITPRLWISNASCSNNVCPLEPPPEAHCQCGDECCPSILPPNLNLLVLTLVLVALGCCYCCWCIFLLGQERLYNESS